MAGELRPVVGYRRTVCRLRVLVGFLCAGLVGPVVFVGPPLVDRGLEKNLPATEFVVLPIFGRTGQPEYQIEIHIGRPDALTLDELNIALTNAQNELTPA
jgi:hypothetical protein